MVYCIDWFLSLIHISVAACFRRIIANRKTPKVEPMVEGYAGFLFLDKNDMPMTVSYTHLDVYKRQVYDLDENGERIKLPSGRWKSHKEDTVDWNDQKYCEIWRHEWEVIQNRYLEANEMCIRDRN